MNKPIIEIVDGFRFDSEFNKEILKFIFKSFGINNSNDRKQYYFSPTYKHLIIRKDNEIISYLRIIKRRVLFLGEDILIGGIGDVSTLKKFRGRGYATKLVKKAFSIFKKEKFDIALLQTDISKGNKLYGSVGFVPANKPYIYKDANGVIKKVKPKDVMIAPVKSNQKMEKIIKSREVLDIGDGDW